MHAPSQARLTTKPECPSSIVTRTDDDGGADDSEMGLVIGIVVALLVCATAAITALFCIKAKRSASHDLHTASATVMSGVFEDPRAANYDSVEPPGDGTYASIAEDQGAASSRVLI